MVIGFSDNFQRHPVLGAVDGSEISLLLDSLYHENIPIGSVVYQQGEEIIDDVSRLFIVNSGSVELEKDGLAQSAPIQRGGVFGDLVCG